MKYINNIFGFCAAAMTVCAVFGCKQEELYEPDALKSAQSITFEAEAAEAQSLTIASNGDWMIDVVEDWITVTPMSGTGSTDVSVTVTDNVDEKGVVNGPREGKITIYSDRGSEVSTTVIQKGDNYKGVEEITIDKVYGLDDETLLKIAKAQVTAVTGTGFVASDGTGVIYVSSEENVTLGSEVSFAGTKTNLYGIASIESDQLSVISESGSEVTYPEAGDFLSLKYDEIQTATYVKATGDLLDNTLFFDPSIPYDVNVLVPGTDDINMDEINKHNIEFEAYFLGLKDGVLTLAFTKILKDNGQSINDGNLEGFPVQWIIGVGNTADKINFTETFPKSGYIDAVEGGGRITYVSLDSKQDPNNKFEWIVGSTGDPYVTGAWPGDYWEFKSDSPVSAGTILSISFEAATSATGHKFWRLEYRDGEDWIVPTSLMKETNEPGETIVYTHIMQPSSSKPVQVAATVKYVNTTDAAHFRFVCAANWQSGGSGKLDAPNGGTMRLTLSDENSTDWQPCIKCVAAGSADLTPAVINVTGLEDGILTFEGTPEASKTITVTSDADFNVSTTASWLHIENGDGLKNEVKEVKITCDPSTLSVMRKGLITVRSAISTYNITVVQSAAGGELDPLISLSTGNSITVLGEGKTFSTSVQANVEYEVEIQGDWITEEPAVSTMAVVEKHEHSFTAATNMTGSDRTGQIRFYNEEYGIESVLTVKQENFVPRVTVSTGRLIPVIGGNGATINFNVDANIQYTVSSDSWIHLPASSGTAGEYQIPVTFDANTSASERTGTVTFTNETYNYEMKLSISQYPSGVVFAEDFEWLEPWALAGDNEGKPAGQTVETDDLDAYCPQLPTSKVDGVSTLQALEAKGYEMLRVWADGKNESECIYLQRNYLKFGKTGYQGGIVLPAITGGSGLKLSFDWCPMRQGSGKLDPVNLIVEVTNGSDVKTFEVEPHGWENGHKLEWIPASIELSGVTVDENTRIAIKQKEWGVSTANRWFLDNIKISAK